MFIDLKDKLRRIDSGMPKEEFAQFLTVNLEIAGDGMATRDRTRFANGEVKPLYLWNFQRYERVKAFRAAAFMVKSDYEEEIMGALLMLGKMREASLAGSALSVVLSCLGVTASHVVLYGTNPADPNTDGPVSLVGTAPAIMALRASQRPKSMKLSSGGYFWFVYPANIYRVNRLLTRTKERHDG